LAKHLDNGEPAWTATAPLPGGDISNADFEAFLAEMKRSYPWLDEPVLLDYARNYGTRMKALLADANSMNELGQHFGGPLYQIEVDYLVKTEWARTAEDILWRRSKKGLHAGESASSALQNYLDSAFAFNESEVLPKVS